MWKRFLLVLAAALLQIPSVADAGVRIGIGLGFGFPMGPIPTIPMADMDIPMLRTPTRPGGGAAARRCRAAAAGGDAGSHLLSAGPDASTAAPPHRRRRPLWSARRRRLTTLALARLSTPAPLPLRAWCCRAMTTPRPMP